MKPLKGLAYLTGACAIAFPIGVYYFFDKAIVRKRKVSIHKTPVETGTNWEQYYDFLGQRKDWLSKQKTEKVSIKSFDGLTLKGTWLLPKEDSNKLVICFHGFRSCGMNDFAALSHFYYELGYQVLLVDNRAHGESDGNYIGFGCLDRKDCVRWIDFAIERMGKDCNICLHGISMGGATVMMTSGMDLPSNIKGIISDCGFTSAWEVFSHVLYKDYHLGEFPLLGVTSKLSKRLAGYAFDECSAKEEVRKTKIPMLFIHGSKDDFVPTNMVTQVYGACGAKKHLLIVDGAGHAESYYYATEDYEKAVSEFLMNYLENA